MRWPCCSCPFQHHLPRLSTQQMLLLMMLLMATSAIMHVNTRMLGRLWCKPLHTS
jgi:hypothetical protein